MSDISWMKKNKTTTSHIFIGQGSPNKTKWVIFSPWFQWNRPITAFCWFI